MAKRSTKHDKTHHLSAEAERVVWVLNFMFSGNRAAMARALGMSHTVINRVVTGQQAPGRQLLTAIADKLRVNPRWLLTGFGDPKASGDREVPISTVILPGPLHGYRNLLSSDMYPVADSMYRDSRYVWQVDTFRTDEMIKVGDRVLFDSDVRQWSEIPSTLDGRLCAVQSAGSVFDLVRLRFYSGRLSTATTPSPTNQSVKPQRYMGKELPHRYMGKELRSVVVDSDLDEQQPISQPRTKRQARQARQVSVDKIVGVAIHLFRPL